MKADIRVFCIDDEKYITESIRDYLGPEFSCTAYNNPVDALEDLKTVGADIIIADYRMPDLNGLQLLLEARRMNSYSKAVLLTAYSDKELLRDVLNNSLVNYVLEKPLNLPELCKIVGNLRAGIIKERESLIEYQRLSEVYSLLSEPDFDFEFIGKNGDLHGLWERALNVASTDENILITGSTGTGKDVLAKQIHTHSKRANRPFIKINCGAIPAQLIESELFGYEKGAFSGAVGRKPGKIELAHCGTLFLDEIGELPPELQSRLLHVVEDKALERLGGTSRIHVDFRLISATNRVLDKQSASEFRRDLFYRISTVHLRLPSLKERENDFPVFVVSLVKLNTRKFGRPEMSVTSDAMKVLRAYSWPGNIRELDNIIKRAVLLKPESETVLTADDFKYYCLEYDEETKSDSMIEAAADDLVKRKTNLNTIEKRLLEEVLRLCEGKIMDASRRSGIPKDRFYRMMEKS